MRGQRVVDHVTHAQLGAVLPHEPQGARQSLLGPGREVGRNEKSLHGLPPPESIGEPRVQMALTA
jgi:hypothetical protein